MATVNVNTEVTDQFYRYKMPKIIAKVNKQIFSTCCLIPEMFASKAFKIIDGVKLGTIFRH